MEIWEEGDKEAIGTKKEGRTAVGICWCTITMRVQGSLKKEEWECPPPTHSPVGNEKLVQEGEKNK